MKGWGRESDAESKARQCARGKHRFRFYTWKVTKGGRWDRLVNVPEIDEVGRWKCINCKRYLPRPKLDATDIIAFRKQKKRVPWEVSEASNREIESRLPEDHRGVRSPSIDEERTPKRSR